MLSFTVSFFITIGNFLVLYLLLRKLLFGKVKDFMDARANKVKAELADAALSKGKAEEMKLRYEELLANAENEGEWVVKDAEERANEESQALLEAARKEAADIRARAEEAAAIERRKSRDALGAEIAQLATAVAARMGGRDPEAEDAIAAERIVRELEAGRV